jgi:hypothetical protein
LRGRNERCAEAEAVTQETAALRVEDQAQMNAANRQREDALLKSSRY